MENADDLVARAEKAAQWAGEPFLREGENPATVLGKGSARRKALDQACAQIDEGMEKPLNETILVKLFQLFAISMKV